MPEKDEMENETKGGDKGDEIVGLREIEKDEEELGSPKQSNKTLIGILSLVIILALFVFFKGEEKPLPHEEVSIQTPDPVVPVPPSEAPEAEGFQDENDTLEPTPGEIRIAGESSPRMPQETDSPVIVPIPQEELSDLEPLSDMESDRDPSESSEMALLKDSVSLPETAKPRPARVQTEKSVKGQRGFTIQLGAFKSKAVADKLDDRLRNNGYDSFVLAVSDDLYRVRVGSFKSQKEAALVAKQIKKTDQLDSFITRE